MSAAETATAVRIASASPLQILQARVFRRGRAESAVPLLVAIGGPILLLVLGLAVRVSGPGLLAMLLIPTPVIEALIVLRYRNLWPAQEVLGRVDWEALEEWSEEGGGRHPSNRRQMEEWLNRHPEGSVPATLRARALLMCGRVAEGRRAIANLPVETPQQRHRRADLEFAADVLDGPPIDTTAADLAIKSDLSLSPALAVAHVAYHAALEAVAGGGDGVVQLSDARPLIGEFPPALVRRVWLGRLRFVISSVVFGAWLWACLVVGLGTASGVVWF